MKIHNYKDSMGISRQTITGDLDSTHEIVNGKIVLKLAATLKAEDLVKCLDNRRLAYSKLNQDELRFDDLINGTTTWKDAILAIKAMFPKPL